MKYLWALLGLLYALLSIYVGYLFFTLATGRLGPKGLLLQAPPVLGGIALVVLGIVIIGLCLYWLVMWRGPKPFPMAPNSDLRSVLKALYLQQQFTALAIKTQA